jgi:hypothetical protein
VCVLLFTAIDLTTKKAACVRGRKEDGGEKDSRKAARVAREKTN